MDGIQQKPIEGVSFAYTFDKANADAPSRHKTQYFEMMGDHAIYHDGWIASTKVIRPPWEVFGAGQPGPAEQLHLGALRPDARTGRRTRTWRPSIPSKVEEMKGLFLAGSPQVPGAAAGRLRGDAAVRAAAEHHRRPQRVRLYPAA